MWPFRKAAPVHHAKGASFFVPLGGRRSSLTGASFTHLAAEGYADSVIAYACINKIAAAVASVEPQLYRADRAGKLVKIESHPLLDLVFDPNPTQSWREFCGAMAAYHQLSGNAYVWGNFGLSRTNAPPRELQLFSPGKVEVVPGDGLFPHAYKHRPTANTVIEYPVDQISGKSAILHVRTFNPLNPWYGQSPLDPAALGVDIHTGGQRWNKGLLDNGARPSGALTVKDGDGKPSQLTDDQYLRLKEMIDRQFAGGANAGRPMLLEGGLEWQEMSLSPKDMDFLEAKHSAARDIALAFGVPPQLLGIPGDNTYSNYSEAKTAFWTDTVIPLLSLYLDALNRWLTPLYGDGLYLWFDENAIQALEPLRKAKFDRIQGADCLSLDEKRAALGYDAYTPSDEPGGTIYIQSSMVPLDMAGMINLAEPGSPADDRP